MKFTTLIEYHMHSLEVELYSGKKYQGVITSHNFEGTSMDVISEISVMGEYSIDRIKCKDIKSIRKLN